MPRGKTFDPDGKIDEAFFERKATEWRAEQGRLLRSIEEHQAANQTYLEEGVALLELAGLVMLLGAVNRDRVGFVHASPNGHLFSEPVLPCSWLWRALVWLRSCLPSHARSGSRC